MLVTISVLLNITVCGYVLFFVNWRDLYDKLNHGILLMDGLYNNVDRLFQLSNSMEQIQGIATQLNTSLFGIQRQLQYYVPKLDVALAQVNRLIDRLNTTAETLERALPIT